MRTLYENWIGRSLVERRFAATPDLRLVVGVFLVFVPVYLVLSLALVPGGEARDFNFADERGAVTALSAVFLAMAAALAVATAALPAPFRSASTLMWLLLAAAFAFLALDELLQGHERIGRWLEDVVGSPPVFRKWNDVVVIGYGVVALPFLAYLLPRLLRLRSVPEMLALSAAFYALHTLVDATQEPPTVTSSVVEESFKAFSSGFAAIAMLAGLLGVVAMARNRR